MKMIVIKSVQEYEKVLAENKSVLVDFYADWCGPCKMIAPVLEEVAKEVPDVKIAKVNVDSLGELAQRYGVMSIPTLIAFKDGKAVNQAVGFLPKPNLIKLAESAK
ncbi:MAG TPA: thioredoxin [Erysipelotrichaceae bacterium]|nr:thioredoxin [Erysipelotrichaceae bacterium]HCY05840.1 thioredoxin [Erysipelotrichaceae bacterium]